jgi:protein-L-isoaspartate O-methyltransferase
MRVSTTFGIFCHRGDSVLDVGANVGQTSEIMSNLVGEAGKVVGFEAVPHIYLQYTRYLFAVHQEYGITTKRDDQSSCDKRFQRILFHP